MYQAGTCLGGFHPPTEQADPDDDNPFIESWLQGGSISPHLEDASTPKDAENVDLWALNYNPQTP